MTTTGEPDFSPYRVTASTPEEFAVEMNDGTTMLVLSGMICALGLPALLFAGCTIYEKAFGCVMAILFLCWIGFGLRHTAARVLVSALSGVHIKTRGPWAMSIHVEKEQIRALQIGLEPRTPRRGLVRVVLTEGPPMTILGFLRVEENDALRDAEGYAIEFTKRIPAPIIPCETIDKALGGHLTSACT